MSVEVRPRQRFGPLTEQGLMGNQQVETRGFARRQQDGHFLGRRGFPVQAADDQHAPA